MSNNTSICSIEETGVGSIYNSPNGPINVEREDPTSTEPTLLENCLMCFLLLFEIIMILFSFWFLMISFTRYGITLCTFHATLSFFGCECLMTIGLLMQNYYSTLGRGCYKSRTKQHLQFMIAAVACFSAGFVTIAIDKRMNKKIHFSTAHSFTGIATIILSTISICLGIILKKMKDTTSRPNNINERKVVHYFFGLITYFVGIISIILGFESNWFKSVSSVRDQIILTFLVLFICLYASFKPLYVFLRRLTSFIQKTVL